MIVSVIDLCAKRPLDLGTRSYYQTDKQANTLK